MNNLIIYELYSAALRAKPSDVGSSMTDAHQFIERIAKKELEIGTLTITDLPTDIKSKTANEFLGIVKDRIASMDKGISTNKSLGYEYFDCHRYYLIAEVLNTLLLKRAALFVAEIVAKKANKFCFLHLSFLAYRIIYSVKIFMNDIKGEIEASNAFKKYLKYYEIEKSIEIDRNRIFHHYNKSSTINAEMVAFCDQAVEEYREYENNIPSYYFHFYYYHILYVKYLTEKKHKEVYLTAKKAVEWFDQLDFKYTPGTIAFIFIQIVYTIQQREYDEGLELLEKAQSFITSKSQHWYRLKENELLLYFHKGDFNKAVSTFFEAFNNSSFISVTPMDQQRWLLYEAYINLVIETGNAKYEERRRRFSIQKFINELPRFSKDKRASNIPVLIAQLLFFIVRKQYNYAIDRIEALEKYSSRYLRNDETFRSNCFIKMLLEIPKNSFNQLRVERSAQKYFERLLDSEIELIDQPFEIEIIPYERLWAMIMKHLRPDHHYRPKTPRATQFS